MKANTSQASNRCPLELPTEEGHHQRTDNKKEILSNKIKEI